MTDEFWSGVAVVAAPALEQEQRLSHSGYTLLVFVVPLLIAAVLEGSIAAASDRWPRRGVIAGGLVALSASLSLCALAHSGVLLSLGLALAGTASGVACAAAQAELVTSHPAGAEVALTRWGLFGAIGDVLTPLLLGAVLAAGGSYRAALWAIAFTSLLQAVAVIRGGRNHGGARARQETRSEGTPPATEASPSDPEGVPALPLGQALREGASNGRLWFWSFGAAACTLLDEIVIAISTLRMQHDLAFSPALATGCATAVSLGGVVGAYAAERLLARMSSTRLLALSALGCCAALVAAVAVRSPAALVPLLFGLGAAAAPQFGLLHARAYAALPGRPGVVNALAQVFVVLDVLAPYAVGLVADRFGLGVALLTLLAQPFTVLVLLWAVRR